jgi:hypothetical protein
LWSVGNNQGYTPLILILEKQKHLKKQQENELICRQMSFKKIPNGLWNFFIYYETQ